MVENFWGTDVILFLKLFYVCCALKLVIYTDILNALLENNLSVACVHLVNSFIQRERKNVATGSAYLWFDGFQILKTNELWVSGI